MDLEEDEDELDINALEGQRREYEDEEIDSEYMEDIVDLSLDEADLVRAAAGNLPEVDQISLRETGVCVGIDLGTTNSAIAILVDKNKKEPEAFTENIDEF